MTNHYCGFRGGVLAGMDGQDDGNYMYSSVLPVARVRDQTELWARESQHTRWRSSHAPIQLSVSDPGPLIPKQGSPKSRLLE